MLIVWILALLVPVLAVPFGAWLMQQVVSVTGLESDVLMVQMVLAAAPLVALALFGLIWRKSLAALHGASVITAILTLLVWTTYHIGVFSFGGHEGRIVFGLAILLSPVAIGLVAIYTYCDLSKRVAS